MYNLTTFIQEYIPVSNSKIQQCKIEITFAPTLYFSQDSTVSHYYFTQFYQCLSLMYIYWWLTSLNVQS